MATRQSKISDPRPAVERPPGLPISRRQAILELAFMVSCVEAIMWIVPLVPDQRTAYKGLALMIVVLLVTCLVRDLVGARRLGFRLDNFPRVLARLMLPLAAFVLITVAVGFAAGTLRFGARFYSMLTFVPPWALLQQYMLLGFSNHRLRLIVGQGRASVVATAALFSLLHLPNPALTVACAAGGYIWAREYEREPNLFATAITHGVASAFLANTLPGWLLKNMVVGYNFFFR
jgi:hypothetical protein